MRVAEWILCIFILISLVWVVVGGIECTCDFCEGHGFYGRSYAKVTGLVMTLLEFFGQNGVDG